MTSRTTACVAALLAALLVEGCAVASATAGAAISVTGAVVSTGVGLTGKAIGAGIDALSPSRPADTSGIVVRERIRPADATPTAVACCAPASGDGSVPSRP
jgi:hypothetical protein